MRTFNVIKPRSSSVLHSATPAGAAKKVCSRSGAKNCIVEVEDNKTKKRYTYRVKKVRDPVTVERGGQEITYEFRMDVKSMNKSKKSRSRKSRSRKSRSRK